jgi:hypothetical protein
MISIINWTGSDTEAMLGYMGSIFDDFSGILILIVSVSLGAIFISVVIDSLRR